MTLRLTTSAQFRRDARRVKKQGLDASELLEVISLLLEEKEIPASMNDHPLKGNLAGFRELHIRSDWLLIYQASEGRLLLQRTGSHSELLRI